MADDFFTNDDPFDDIVSSFFGRPVKRARRVTQQEEQENADIGFLETSSAIYCMVEVPGYTEDEVLVKVKGRELEIQAQKKKSQGIKEYLAPKLEKGIVIQRTLPESASSRKFTYTYKNGILEVRFDIQ